MPSMLYYLTFLAAAAVFVVLVLGILNLARNPKVVDDATGASPPRQTNLSQQLMRWRVALQFLAIIIIMLTLYMTR